MKRVLSLVLTLALLFSFVSLSFAAVTVGGNVRTWLYSASDKTQATENQQSAMGFFFDRIALKVKGDLSAVNGIDSEISFRETDKNGEIRVDKAFYYQKGIFGEKDQLQVGYIEMPFYNANYSAITVQSLAYNLGMSGSVGVKYVNTFGNTDFAFALANSNNKNQTNLNDDKKGQDSFDMALRLGFAPMENIKVGLGYGSDNVNDNESYTKMVLDSNGQFGPIGYFFEYFSNGIKKTGDSKDGKSATGTYFEASYKLGDTKLYAGRGISLNSKDAKFGTVAKFGLGSNTNFEANNDWTVIGCAIPIGPKTVLQPEYISVDPVAEGKDKTLIAARLRVDF